MRCCLFIWMFMLLSNLGAQSIVLNKDLLEQLTKNHAVRTESNNLYRQNYEAQNKKYEEIKVKLTTSILIQDFIYDHLTNINKGLKQSKQISYLYKNLEEISDDSVRLLSLTINNPEYAVLQYQYYLRITEETIKLSQEINNQILLEDKNYLFDPYDRLILIETALHKSRLIKGFIGYLIMVLEHANTIPYLYQIPNLGNYIQLDRLIVQDIMQKYNYLKI